MLTLPKRVGFAVLVLAFSLWALPLPAAAQRIVLVYSPQLFVAPPVIESWNLTTGMLEWRRPGRFAQSPVFTWDGLYLVAPSFVGTAPGFTVQDVVSGASLTVPVAFTPIVAHPRATAVFGLASGVTGPGTDVVRIDAGGLTIYGGCQTGTARHLDIATDGGRLLVVCESGELVVLHALSGVELRRMSVAATGQARQVASNRDGSQAVVVRGSSQSSGDIALVDTVTGATLIATAFPGPPPLPASDDCVSGALVGAAPDRSQIVVTCSWTYSDPRGGPTVYSAISRLLDAGTLAWGPDLGVRYYPRTIALSPDNTQAFSLSTHPRGFGVYQAIALPAATTTALLAPTAPSGLAVAFAPLAAVLTVAVRGATANLQWALPAHSPAATSHVLEVGTAPGVSNLGTLRLGPSATFNVPAVPSGTYYVRVRAGNSVGLGAVSNEVTVVVPSRPRGGAAVPLGPAHRPVDLGARPPAGQARPGMPPATYAPHDGS